MTRTGQLSNDYIDRAAERVDAIYRHHRPCGLLNFWQAGLSLMRCALARKRFILTVLGHRRQVCNGLNRRTLLQAAGAGLFGAGLPQVLAAEEAGAVGPSRAKSVIFVFLFGIRDVRYEARIIGAIAFRAYWPERACAAASCTVAPTKTRPFRPIGPSAPPPWRPRFSKRRASIRTSSCPTVKAGRSRLSCKAARWMKFLHSISLASMPAFTHIMACLLAGPPTRSFPSKASTASSPPPPLRLLPAGATSCRAGLSPAGKPTPFRWRTE